MPNYFSSTTEILDLATLTWRPGPDLPKPVYHAASFQYGDTFGLAGGSTHNYHLGAYYDTVYLYNPEVN